MNYKEHLKLKLENEEFKKEYDNLEIEFDLAKTLILARNEMNLTQRQLADKIGISDVDINKLENGDCTISLVLLKNIARVLNKKLVIKFE